MPPHTLSRLIAVIIAGVVVIGAVVFMTRDAGPLVIFIAGLSALLGLLAVLIPWVTGSTSREDRDAPNP